MKQFYSYLWLRADGSPYYAGKGTGDRAYVKYNHRIGPPKERSRILIFPMLNEDEAFESEIALIELFGRKDIGTGCLRNLTGGGENPPVWTRRGYKRSAEFCRKLSERSQGNTYMLGKKLSVEARRKISESNRGRKFSAEHRAKLSAAKTRVAIR
jgi:hypothetical protein